MSTSGVTRGKSTPIMVDLKLHEFDKDEPDVDEPFRSLVGHLMWLANQTRPDIHNTVRAVSRYSAVPKLFHWQAARRIAMYIKSTSTYGITFRRGLSSGVQMEFCVDADYAHEANDRKSVSGGVVMCAGACVSCRFTVAHRKSSRCVLRKRTTWRRPREFARRVHAVCLESHFSRSRCWMSVSYTHLTLPTTPYV